MEGTRQPHPAATTPLAFPATAASPGRGSRTGQHRLTERGHSGTTMATALLALLTGVFARGSRDMKPRTTQADAHPDPSRDQGAARVPAVQADLARVTATLPEGAEIDWP
ncbi:hypothetical protein [Nonomuraea typhae]|uniref:hypothetical protein n=1 Tax=Nonomuraea typhae TaxID=2603600 RepID=UPI0012FB44EB|nr:hypothetical protein [Nonomuraea typhae]